MWFWRKGNKSTGTRHRLKLGVIGLGYISDIHLATFLKNEKVEVQAVADTNELRLTQQSRKFGISRAYRDYRAILADKTIDVVDVLLPHFLHAACVIEALEAGKDVICEKPLATKVSDIDRIIKTIVKTKKRVHLKQYLRFSRLHQRLKVSIGQGIIGQTYLVHCLYTGNSLSAFTDPSLWRGNRREAGGGVLMDIGIHAVDLLQWLFGDPVAVFSFSPKPLGQLAQKSEDVSLTTVEFKNNTVANIVCTGRDSSLGFRWEKHFFGLEGSLHLEDFGKAKTRLTLMQNQKVQLVEEEPSWWTNANTNALNDAIARIYLQQAPAIPLSQARMTVDVIAKAYRAAAVGRKQYLQAPRPTAV